jgi:hypothetical protein
MLYRACYGVPVVRRRYKSQGAEEQGDEPHHLYSRTATRSVVAGGRRLQPTSRHPKSTRATQEPYYLPMGLDGVEFVMAVEEAFGIAIPDSVGQDLMTPGHVVRYVESRLHPGERTCIEQRAFYALRRAAMGVLNQPRAVFRPDTRWDAVLPSRDRRRTWKLLHSATGVATWPTMWLWGSIPTGHETMGDTAQHLATHAAAALQKPGAGWSRKQIEDIVTALIREHLGIKQFDWDQRFVQDLGVD